MTSGASLDASRRAVAWLQALSPGSTPGAVGWTLVVGWSVEDWHAPTRRLAPTFQASGA